MDHVFPEEHFLKLNLNGTRTVTLICTNDSLREMILGYLYTEGIITSLADVRELSIAPDGASAHVVLNGNEIPAGEVRASGLGGTLLQSVSKDAYCPLLHRYSMPYIQKCVDQMLERTARYGESGGVHCSALFSEDGLLSTFEDVGRHNTLDKIAGSLLLRGEEYTDTLLVTTGRISSEMARKAVMIGASAIVSLSTPTSAAIDYARKTNVTLIAYFLRNRLVCTAEDRIAL